MMSSKFIILRLDKCPKRCKYIAIMSHPLGTVERPLRVAIVGSGPSGFYAAEPLISSPVKVKVDMFDRLPVPFGLVRYGVAPDHSKIKNVIKVYEKIALNPAFGFFGNVEVGKDIVVEELKQFYDVILFTCGAQTDKKIGIPGEDLLGSHTATEFVAWYNGHPDYANRKFDLSSEAAVVVGQGNVAMDVSRILCKTVDELKNTDIAQHALEALAQSKIKEVHLIGRRGPAQAAFTSPEIKEFGELADCDPWVEPQDLVLNEASQKELENPSNAAKKKNYEILKNLAALPERRKQKKFFIHFLKSPVSLLGNSRVEKLILEKNVLSGEANNQKAKGTGVKEELPCGIFFRSVGYKGVAISGVPFDETKGTFPNKEGRLLNNGQVALGLYAAGWIKRGPSGVIGTNKPDSEETVKKILEDAPQLKPCVTPDTNALKDFLKKKGLRPVSFEDWKKIDAAEIERGILSGKPREKFVKKEDMLKIL